MLLAASLNAGTLSVLGSGGNDVIAIDADNATVDVTINGQTQSFSTAEVRRISLDAMPGDDQIAVSDAVRFASTLRGGAGDDSIRGGAGNDLIIPGLGNDTLDGGAGGFNTAYYAERTIPVSFDGYFVSTGAGAETDELLDNVTRVMTGSGDDQIGAFSSSVRGVRYLDAGAGDDTVELIFAHGGSDITLRGGAGNDDLMAISRDATAHYFGDAGDDTMRVYRSSGTVRIFHGGRGIDTMDFSAFSNEYWPVKVSLDGLANDGSPTEYHSIGDGVLRDNVDVDVERVIGTPGPDTITGGSGNETLIGNGGDDWLDGSAGNDRLEGGEGDDTLIGGPGADALDGGTGENTLIDGISLSRALSLRLLTRPTAWRVLG